VLFINLFVTWISQFIFSKSYTHTNISFLPYFPIY
jgi:hypothetical protein